MSNNKDKHPFDLFGIECGEGWKKLYQPLIDYVKKYNIDHAPNSFIEITQIKEKFGGLRFYWSGENVDKDTTDKLREMVDDAEAKSWTVCEECGSEEEVGILNTGWFYTRCRKCAKKIVEKIGREGKWTIGDGKIYIIDKNGKIE